MLGGPKQRAVLAQLLLHPNEVVSRGRLIDGLWGDNPPEAAQRSLDSYVSRLRGILGGDRVVRRPPGYVLRVEPNELDADRFRALLETATARSAMDDPQRVSEALDEALGLWRGAALADLLDEPFAPVEAARLEDLRLHAVEQRLEARLALGESATLIQELEQLVHDEPFRERLRGQLMLALYRCGRQAEALDAFQAYRRFATAELGLEPGPQLQELQRRVLEHDPALAPPPPRSRVGPRRGRLRLVVAIGLAISVIAGALGTALSLRSSGSNSRSPSVTSGQILAITSGRVARPIPLQAIPAGAASGGGALWVSEPDASDVVRIDPSSLAVVDRIPIEEAPGPIAYAGGSVWVTGVLGGRVFRIDPKTDRVSQSLSLGTARAAALAPDGSRLWIADVTDNALLGIDTATGGRRGRVLLEHSPSAVIAAGRAVWVTSYDAGVVDEIDPQTRATIATIRVGNGPVALGATPHAIWVANSLDSTVSRINPSSGRVIAVLAVGSAPAALAYADGNLWVANEYGATLSRVDVEVNRVVGSTRLGGAGTSITAAAARLWVGVRPLGRHRGGTLTMLSQRPVTIDPALQLDLPPPQTDGLTRDTLVTYDHAGGLAGLQLVPDLAISIPVPTDGGTTYTFRLRPGLRYSNGHPVRAADFRRAIERELYLGTSLHALFRSLRGAAACQLGVLCDLSRSIVSDERARTVTYHLAEPDPTFLTGALTSAATAPVPRGTAFDAVGYTHVPIPGTGPYEVTSATAKAIRYVRNPHFHEWSHAAQPDGNPDVIVMRFGLTPTQEALAVERGTADWTADQVPPGLLPQVERKFGSRLHSFSTTETDFFRFNTSNPTFRDARARRAVNLALDRRALVRAYGGTAAATPTCQVIPPGLAGYRPYCPYSLGTRHTRWIAADRRRAKRLVAASGTDGATVRLWGFTDDPSSTPRVLGIIARTLRSLGYRVHLRTVSHSYFDSHDPRLDAPDIDLIPAGWEDTAPASFFTTWLSCSAPFNFAYCNTQLDRITHAAQAAGTNAPRRAAILWSAADRLVVDNAALLPLVNTRQLDFVSARVQNFQHHPYWDVLVDQFWLR